MADVADLVRVWSGNVVIFDDALSPAQQRNLEKAIGCKVIDRSALILDIFAQRARSTEGKLQVELAQSVPAAASRAMEPPAARRRRRHRGPSQAARGRSAARARADHDLRRRLDDLARTGVCTAQAHCRPDPAIALVGYTNAGKSTPMNALTQAGVLVEDRLFATLDPTVRRLRLPGRLTVALADTVGFIPSSPIKSRGL